jgi:hypothetical protein
MTMVSLKLDNNLALLEKSGILKEIPYFGIQENDLIDIIANAPAKSMLLLAQLLRLHSIITLVEKVFFWQHYARQEAHNYFEDLEEKVIDFPKLFILINNKISLEELTAVLKEEYGYTIQELVFSEQEELGDLRSIFVPQSKTLLSLDIDEQQKPLF